MRGYSVNEHTAIYLVGAVAHDAVPLFGKDKGQIHTKVIDHGVQVEQEAAQSIKQEGRHQTGDPRKEVQIGRLHRNLKEGVIDRRTPSRLVLSRSRAASAVFVPRGRAGHGAHRVHAHLL